MRHLSEAELALHAGGDLSGFARWRAERHLARCQQCTDELESYARTVRLASALEDMPELHWNRLAMEMKANIRLGVAAGECVRTEPPPLREAPWYVGIRGAVAFASAVALLVTGLMLERPSPLSSYQQGVELQSTASGIQVREGRAALRLMHRGAAEQEVTYTPDAQGSMRARYMDPETGYVTVTNVYAE
jgi:hypothetical protein